MNKDNAAEFLPLVQALADGKTIQLDSDSEWIDTKTVHFIYEPDQYRIKPELYESWVNEYKGMPDVAYKTKNDALDNKASYCIRTIHVRQVVE